MIKVSELLSKRLVCLSTAEIVGTISNIIFDNKLNYGKLLKIYNDDDSDAETKYVELKKIKSLSFDAVTVADSSHITTAFDTVTDGVVNPINCECFNQDGKFLGKVTDITLDGAKVEKLHVGNIGYLPKEVLTFSKKLVIINDTGKPLKISKPKQSGVPLPQTGENQTAVIHSGQSMQKSKIAGVSLPSKVSKQNTVVLRSPMPVENGSSGYGFLLGKTIAANIKNQKGDIILRKGDKITDESISAAKDAGRMVQLALHAE